MEPNDFLPVRAETSPSALAVNLAAAAVAGAGLVVASVWPAVHGRDEAVRCIDCGACNAVGDACPGAIEDEAGLVASARAGDVRAFVDRAGLLCTRCGICSSLCPVGLDLARIFGAMHEQVRGELAKGAVAPETVRAALREGRIGGEFIKDALKGLEDR